MAVAESKTACQSNSSFTSLSTSALSLSAPFVSVLEAVAFSSFAASAVSCFSSVVSTFDALFVSSFLSSTASAPSLLTNVHPCGGAYRSGSGSPPFRPSSKDPSTGGVSRTLIRSQTVGSFPFAYVLITWLIHFPSFFKVWWSRIRMFFVVFTVSDSDATCLSFELWLQNPRGTFAGPPLNTYWLKGNVRA